MGVSEISHILISQHLSLALLVLLAQAILGSEAVPALVLAHVPEPPKDDDKDLESEACAAGRGAGYVARRVLGSEDLGSDHVAHAVRDERQR